MDIHLKDNLVRAGFRTEILEQPNGSAILVLPYGGRVLGLYAAGSTQNFLWTHPALQSETLTRAFYSSDAWHNSGGDRAWLAPEIDFFLPNFPEVGRYIQPREFDPGNYECSRDTESLTLTNQFSSKLSRSGRVVHLRLSRQVCLAINPLHQASAELAEQLAYAGYSLRSRLEFTAIEPDPPRVGLWNLLQMPHAGDLFVPTVARSKVCTYMGTIGSEELAITDHLIRYRINAVGEHKLGVPARQLTGRAGYLYRSGSDFCLIVRNFFVDPSGTYIDVPWHDPASEGSAVQACNVNSSLGAFSELEYHAPAIGGPGGPAICDDVSQVWAFRGRETDVRKAARILISPDL